MTLPTAHSNTTIRTVSMSSEPGATTLLPSTQLGITGGATTLRAVNMGQVQYVNGAMDAGGVYGNVRYLMPVQRNTESYVVVNQAPQMYPVYLQNVQRVLNTVDESTALHQLTINGKTSSEISLPPSPIKSPEPEEVTFSNSVHEKVETDSTISRRDVRADFVEIEPLAKLDTRFFGELLADVYRKNCDIHSCISEHVSKISGRKHSLDSDNKAEKEEIEQLIPKGVSELTKQQIRYLLQTRVTADKTMRVLLSTFSTLKEELMHLQEDLRRLESEKEQLERDLSFKADQAKQYDKLLESVRENNRQLQNSLKESSNAQRTLESQLMNNRSTDTSKDFRIKDLESGKRTLEQENELLRKKLENQSSTSSNMNAKTQELSRHYEKMLSELREEKERELASMRSQLIKVQTEQHTTDRSSDRSLQLKITELMSTVEQRDSSIRRMEEEIRRLQVDKQNLSRSSTTSTVTKTYSNQYPILGLLSDNYQYTPPISGGRTVVVKSTEERITK